MKRIFILVFALLIFSAGSSLAEDTAPLGKNNFALQLDLIEFIDKDHNFKTVFFGLEFSRNLTKHLYIAPSIGIASRSNMTATVWPAGVMRDYRVTFIPIELNMKYLRSRGNFVFVFGGGLSANYASIELGQFDVWYWKEADWLFGAQALAEINYKFKRFFTGLNAKYQHTEDFDSQKFNFSNWRGGLQVGFFF